MIYMVSGQILRSVFFVGVLATPQYLSAQAVNPPTPGIVRAEARAPTASAVPWTTASKTREPIPSPPTLPLGRPPASEATALAGPIDTKVLYALIEERLEAAAAEALRRVLVQPSKENSSNGPIKDLSTSFASLIVKKADLEARSQAVAMSVTRAGLSYAIAALVRDKVLDDRGCPGDITTLADTAYEGLALSHVGRLGFIAATGKAPEGCGQLAASIAAFVDTAVRIPISSIRTLEDSRVAATKGLHEIQTDCTDGPAGLADALSLMNKADLTSFVNGLQMATAMRAPNGSSSECVSAIQSLQQDWKVHLADLVPDLLKNVETVDQVLTAATQAVSAKLNEEQKARLEKLRTIALAVAHDQRLRRDRFIEIIELAKSQVSEIPNDSDGEPERFEVILVVALDALKTSVREGTGKPLDISVDVPALVATLARGFEDSKHWARLYVRATIGAGYALDYREQNRAAYEELGLGLRLGRGDLQHSFHGIVSGLLFAVTGEGSAEHMVFFGGGYSLKILELIELSANGGAGVDLDGKQSTRFVALLGLQLPLEDYLAKVGSE